MKITNPHIVYLGKTRFPYGFGVVNRLTLISLGMMEQGCRVTVLSYKGTHGPDKDFPPEGEFKGIRYRYLSGSIHPPKGFFKRNFTKLHGKWKELSYLRKLKKNGDLDGCITNTMDFDKLLIYRLWLKWMKVPLILDYVELNSAIGSRTSLRQKINDYFFDRFATRLADGVSPISEYLLNHTNRQTPGKPVVKMPILCDFEKFNARPEVHGETRLLYCGTGAYWPLTQFLLEAFDQLEIGNRPVFLHFILGASADELAVVKDLIAKSRNKANVRLYSNLPDSEIPQQLANANALLIPLRPGLQDKARFPHKLGEYLASAAAVITTNFGEVNHYDFTDGQTALVAKGYDPKTFSEKMKMVVENPEWARTIGAKGRQMGLRNFDYKIVGKRMLYFMLMLNGKWTHRPEKKAVENSKVSLEQAIEI